MSKKQTLVKDILNLLKDLNIEQPNAKNKLNNESLEQLEHIKLYLSTALETYEKAKNKK